MISYIPLTRGKVTLVDTMDYSMLIKYKWMFHGGYARRVEKGQTVHLHRFIMRCPYDLEVDHINRNKLDNRRANLRIVTRQQNMCNKSSYKESSSIYKGVTWHKKDKIWHAQIRFNNRIHYLGSYEEEVIAAYAYNIFAKKYFGEYAVLNDVPNVDISKYKNLNTKGTSKYKGIIYRNFKWIARITINGNRKILGYYNNEVDAALAYNLAYKNHYGKEGPNWITV